MENWRGRFLFSTSSVLNYSSPLVALLLLELWARFNHCIPGIVVDSLHFCVFWFLWCLCIGFRCYPIETRGKQTWVNFCGLNCEGIGRSYWERFNSGSEEIRRSYRVVRLVRNLVDDWDTRLHNDKFADVLPCSV